MAKSQAAWGIEIGAYAIKAIRLDRDGDDISVTDYAYVPHKKVLSSPDTDQREVVRLSLGQFISEKKLEGAGYVIHFVHPSKPKRLSRGWFKQTRKMVVDIHNETPIDVIHSNEFAGFGITPWARKNNIPIALLCHGSDRSDFDPVFMCTGWLDIAYTSEVNHPTD